MKQLLNDLYHAQQAEEAARKKRIELESEIEKLFESQLGTRKTFKPDGFKVTINRPLYRKLDTDKWQEIASRIPVALRPVKTKVELDEKGYNWLRDNDPDNYRVVATAVTEKPGKASVKVEVK